MRKPRSVLVLLLLLVFGVFVVVPAEDIPETLHDESETLPYESTPLFTIALPQIYECWRMIVISSGSAYPVCEESLRASPSQRIASRAVAMLS